MAQYIEAILSKQEWVIVGKGPKRLVDISTKEILDLFTSHNVIFTYINVLDDVNLKTDIESYTGHSIPTVFQNGEFIPQEELKRKIHESIR